MKIKDAVRLYLANNDQGQQKLADLVGVSQQSVSGWKHGAEPKGKNREKLIEILARSGYDVFTVEEEEPRRSRAYDRYEFAVEIEADFQRELSKIRPEDGVRGQYQCRLTTPFGVRIVDYINDKVVVEIKTISPDRSLPFDRTKTEVALFHLAAVRKSLEANEQQPERKYLLIVVAPGLENRMKLAVKFQALAFAFGIYYHVVESPKEAADFVFAHETGTDTSDDESDELV